MKAKRLSILLILFFIINSTVWGRPFERFYYNSDSLEYVLKFQTGIERYNTLICLAEVNIYISTSKSLELSFESYNLSLQLKDTLKSIFSLSQIANTYYTINKIDSAEFYFGKVKELTNSSLSDENLAYAMFYIGDYLKNNKYYIQAFEKLNDAYSLFEKLNMKDMMALSKAFIGDIYKNIKEFQKAKDYYVEALKITNDCEDLTLKPYIMISLGYIEQRLGNKDKAVEIFNNVEYISSNLNYIYGIVNSNIFLGSFHTDFGDLDTALLKFETANKILDKYNILSEKSIVTTKIAHIYSLKGDFTEQFKYILESLEIRKIVGNKSLIGSAYINLGSAYLNLKKYSEAKKNIEIGIYEISLTKEYNLIYYAYNKLSEYYNNIKDYRNSYLALQLSSAYKDSLILSENLNEVLKFQFKYEFEKKQNEVKQEQINRKNENTIYLTIAIIGLFISGIFLTYSLKNSILISSNLQKKKLEQFDKINEQRIELKTEIEEKELKEQQLETALKSEKEFNKLKSKFVSMVSTEFRTPISGISASTDFLKEFSEKHNIKSKVDKYFKRIDLVTNRIDHLMSDILLIGKIDAGVFSFNPKLISLEKLISELLTSINKTSLKSKNITIASNGLKRNVFVDPYLFTNIIDNLLSNAIKFTKGKENPEITINYFNDCFELIIKDYGIGIPDEDQKSLFQSFFRAKNSAGIVGTGLGLVIVKQFVEMHKGNITISSKENEGTFVKILIKDKGNIC